MLKPNDIKPFLLHEDSIIRRFAASYLEERKIYDEDIMPLLLQAYRMEKNIELRGFIAMRMKSFPQTQETIISLDRLSRNVADNRLHFESALANADVNLILNNPKKISFTIKEFSDFFRYRLELSQKDTNSLWDEYIEICSIAKYDYDNFKYGKAKALAKELCSRDDVPMNNIHNWFKLFDSKDPDFDEVFMCLLAGNLKLTEYSSLLIDCLHMDWDYINEESLYALTKMQSSQVVEEIGYRYHKENDTFKIFSSGVLRNTKIQESENVISALLEKPLDKHTKSMLLFSLCRIGSEKAIEYGIPLLPDKYDTQLDSLEKNLYVVSILNGIDHPKLKEWKTIIDNADERSIMMRNSFKTEG